MPNPLRKLKFGKLAKGKDDVAPAATPANASLGRPGAEGATEAGPSHHPAHGSATNAELPPAYDGISTADYQALEESFREAAPVLAEASGPQSQQPGIATLTLEAEEDSSSPSESFGLFEFTPRAGARPARILTASLSAAQAQQQIDIIAVHGLGGHWTKTWQAPDGAIWFRDRIPAILAESGIACRVRSFGYNSAFTFTKGETNIAGSAKDLIDRVRLLRGKDIAGFRPIIFVAHSLGGIVVKEALNIAWTKHRLYEDILESVKGCIFMGVPHHGASIAKWAKHATQIVKTVSLGFSGNTNFLKTLEKSSPDWVRISRDFVERGRGLSIRSFYETERTGGILVVDEASASLHVPQEQSFALPGSDHRTVCRFSDSENERFSLVGNAMSDLAQGSLQGATPRTTLSSGNLVFDLPSATANFFGRTGELTALREMLDPSTPGRKGVVLYGLAGSGKTQLVLKFIQDCGSRYSAVIWINASSQEQTVQSFADVSETISALWPTRDLPITYYGTNPERRVLLRLRSTMHNHWLLVIDSADDIEAIHLSNLIPDCKHGSVVVTSTRRSAAELLEGHSFISLEVDSLDNLSASQLILSTAHTKPTQEETPRGSVITDIANELYGIPLALEQAGALIRKRIVTFDNFLHRYRTHYKSLMAKRFPAATSYDKGHSVIAMLSFLFSSVEADSSESARLLEILAVLGPRKIPFGLLRTLSITAISVSENLSTEATSRDRKDTDDTLLRLYTSALTDVCLVKSEENQSGTEEFVSIHGLISQWLVDKVLDEQKWEIYSVVRALIRFIWPDSTSPFAVYNSETPSIRKTYLPVLERAVEIASKSSPDQTRGPRQERKTTISRDMAYIYLYGGQLNKAREFFLVGIEEAIAAERDDWPSTESALELLLGLASCDQRSGDEKGATDNLKTSLQLAERLFDNFDDRTAEINTRLKSINERREFNLDYHKSVVVASTGPTATKMRPSCLGFIGTEGPETFIHVAESQDRSLAVGEGDVLPVEDVQDRDARLGDRLVGMDAHALHVDVEDGEVIRQAGPVVLLQVEAPGPVFYVGVFHRFVLMCNSHQWDLLRSELQTCDYMTIKDRVDGMSLLIWLLRFTSNERGAMCLLRERGQDVDVHWVDHNGRTAFYYAVEHEYLDLIRLLVNNFGVDVNREDQFGQTALTQAIDSHQIFSFTVLVELGADESVTMDHTGWTPRLAAAAYGWRGRPEIVHEFSAVNVNRLDRRRRTALHNAVMGGVSVKHIKILIDWGVNVNAQDEDGNTILHLAMQNKGFAVLDMLRFMVQEVKGVNLNLPNSAGESPLMTACRVGNSGTAMFLMNFDHTTLHFSQFEFQDRKLRPAVRLAIKYDRLYVIANMVKLGYFDVRGDTQRMDAILAAASNEAYGCLSYLVAAYPEQARQTLRKAPPGWSGSVEEGRIIEAMAKHDIATEGVADKFRKWVGKQPK